MNRPLLLFSVILLAWDTVFADHVHQFHKINTNLPDIFNKDGILTRGDSQDVFSLCPNVTADCVCYDSGDDIVADCFDAMLDEVPEGLPDEMTILRLSGTSLTIIPTDAFVDHTNLTRLEITDNSPEKIEPGAFNKLLSLEYLELRANNLTSVPSNILSPCPYLKMLDVTMNRLTSLFDITHLNKLKEIQISNNMLDSLADRYFSGNTELETIHLDKNQLSHLTSFVFTGLSKLKTLDLSVNKLSAIPDNLFDPLHSVELINISSNLLSSIKSNQFVGPGSSLIQLYMSNNLIQNIDPDAFTPLTNLDLLDLQDNLLTEIPDALNQIPAVDFLYLSGNLFSTIPAYAFSQITELRTLYLQNMPSLTSIDVHAFRGVDLLQQLVLGKNPNLTEFTTDHLPDGEHPHLLVLSLNDNGFTYLSEEIFIHKNLFAVFLQGNPFHCDCKLKWMSQVVLDGLIWALNWKEDSTSPRCTTPHHVEDFKISAMLPHDLSCDDVTMRSIKDDPVVAYLHGNASLEVLLQNGLPASKWITPDGTELVPLRLPPGKTNNQQKTFKQLPKVTEHYTANHDVIATLYFSNATSDVAGTYRAMGSNGNGMKDIDVRLEVLPYELTVPPPTDSRSVEVKIEKWTLLTFILLSLYV